MRQRSWPCAWCGEQGLRCSLRPSRAAGRWCSTVRRHGCATQRQKALTAEGSCCIAAIVLRLDGYRYCSQAVSQARRGELRKASALRRVPCKGLAETGSRCARQRDFAIAYSYAGDLDSAGAHARETLQHVAKNPAIIVAGPAYKTLGDVATRRRRHDEAIGLYAKGGRGGEQALPRAGRSVPGQCVARRRSQRRGACGVRAAGSWSQRWPAACAHRRAPAARRGRVDRSRKYAFESAARGAAGADADYNRLWALDSLARTWLARGDRREAQRRALEAATLAKAYVRRFRSGEFKTGLFGDIRQVFELAVALSMELGETERAWALFERSRGARCSTPCAVGSTGRSYRCSGGRRGPGRAAKPRCCPASCWCGTTRSKTGSSPGWSRRACCGEALPIARRDLETIVDEFRRSIFRRAGDADTRACPPCPHRQAARPAVRIQNAWSWSRVVRCTICLSRRLWAPRALPDRGARHRDRSVGERGLQLARRGAGAAGALRWPSATPRTRRARDFRRGREVENGSATCFPSAGVFPRAGVRALPRALVRDASCTWQRMPSRAVDPLHSRILLAGAADSQTSSGTWGP